MYDLDMGVPAFKSDQTCSLDKRIDFLQEVVKTMKEKNFRSESGIEMSAEMCSMPGVIRRIVIRIIDKDVSCREKYASVVFVPSF